MLRRFAPAIMILVCFILDTTLLPIVYGGVYTVPLTAVAVLLIGILNGRMSGLLHGTIGGLLIDITTGTLGMMTFYFMAIGFMIGLILYNPGDYLRSGRRKTRRRHVQRFAWSFVLYGLGEVTLFVMQYFNTASIRPVFFINIAIRSLICATMTLVFYPLAYALLVGNRNRIPSRDREVRSF